MGKKKTVVNTSMALPNVYDNYLAEKKVSFFKLDGDGVAWFKKRHSTGCPGGKACSGCYKPLTMLHEILKKKKYQDHILVKKKTYLFGIMKRETFLKNLKTKKNQYLYEVFHEEYKRKAYIDIDGKKPCLDPTIKEMKKLFGENVKMAISGSEGVKNNKKYYSYHIVFPDIVFKDLQHMKDSGFVNYIKSIAVDNVDDKNYNGIDKEVYGRNQAFKAVFQKKDERDGEDRIQKIMQNKCIEDHIIQLLPSKNYKQLDKELLAKLAPYQPLFQRCEKTKKMIKVAGKRKKVKRTHAIKKLENEKPPKINTSTASCEELLFAIPNTKPEHKLGYSLHWQIGLWFYHQSNGLGYKKYREWEKRHYKNDDKKPYTTERMWNEYKEKDCLIKRQHIIQLLQKFYGYIPKPAVVDFLETVFTGTEYDKLIQQKYINPDHFNYRKTIQLIKAGMGSGKTYAVIEELIKIFNTDADSEMLWITNRVSMANNIMGRLNGNNCEMRNTLNKYFKKKINAPGGGIKNYFEPLKKIKWTDAKKQYYKELISAGKAQDRNLNFTHYKEVVRKNHENKKEQNKDKSKEEIDHQYDYQYSTKCMMEQEKRLVCEVESLHYTENVEYDVLIIDEIESVYHSFISDTCHKGAKRVNKYTKNYLTLTQHIRQAKKIFIMDAYLHKRTTKWLKDINPDVEINLIMRDEKYDLDEKEVRKLEANNWVRKIVDDLKKNLKLYIFYPYKTGKGSLWDLSIESFKNKIKVMAGLEDKDFKVYHGDTDSEVRRKLENVNTEWKNIKCVITNSSITVGVNYDNENDFDKCYLAYADFILPRDIMQTSLRVRNFKYKNKNGKDVIFLCKFPSFRAKKGENEFQNPTRLMNLDLDTSYENFDLNHFNTMKYFLRDEFDAKCFETVIQFMQMSGYTVKTESGEKEIIKKFKEEFKNANFDTAGIWEYHNIKSITEKEKEEKEERIKLDFKAETDDKLQVRKWYVDNMCMNMTNVNEELHRYATAYYEKINKKNDKQQLQKIKKACRRKAAGEEFKTLFKTAIENYEKKKKINFTTGGLAAVLWEKPRIFEGLKNFFYGDKNTKKLLNMALTYWNGIEKDKLFVEEENICAAKRFKYNTTPLSEEDKQFILQQLHIDYELKNPKKYMEKNDYILKRYILKANFGRDMIEQTNKGKIVLSQPIILGMCLLELNTCCLKNKINFTDRQIKEIEEARDMEKMFQQGKCLIDIRKEE